MCLQNRLHSYLKNSLYYLSYIDLISPYQF